MFREYFGYLCAGWLIFIVLAIGWEVWRKRDEKDNKNPPKFRQLVDACKHWYRYWFCK